MPRKSTVEKAKKDLRQGKRPTTAAGEFVKEEMEHAKEGKHPVRSRKQAIAIGLSKARRAGVPLGAPKKGRAKPKTRRSAARDTAKGKKKATKPSARRRTTTGRAKAKARPARSRSRKTGPSRRRSSRSSK